MTDPDIERIKGERKFWGKVADQYDTWIDEAFSDQYVVNKSKLDSIITPQDTILEIGCGPGDMAFFLAPKCKKYVGSDLSPDMIAVAQKKAETGKSNNLTFQVEDSYDLSFSENSFDKIICVNALQVMKEPQRAVAETFRVLKGGGELVSITYLFGESGLIEYFKLTKWLIKYGKPKYWHNFKEVGLIGMFKGAGFKIIEKELIWKKPKVLFLRCRKTT